jgi:hypothetical protein
MTCDANLLTFPRTNQPEYKKKLKLKIVLYLLYLDVRVTNPKALTLKTTILQKRQHNLSSHNTQNSTPAAVVTSTTSQTKVE